MSISLYQGCHNSYQCIYHGSQNHLQRGRCLPAIREKPERLCILPILPYRESFEKGSNRHGYNNSNNPTLTKALQMSIRNPVLIPRTEDLFLNPLVTNKTLHIVGWVVSGKGFLQKDYQNRLSHSCQMLEAKAQSITMNRPEESRIAGLVGDSFGSHWV